MSDKDSIDYVATQDLIAQEVQWQEALIDSALEKCIYLFVEGQSEEIAKVPIKRHVKIMSQANPFDPFGEGFLNERKVKNTGRNSWFAPVATAL